MIAHLVTIALLVVVLLKLYQRIGLRLGILDYPSNRGQHAHPVVVGAGIVITIVVVFVIGLLGWFDKSVLNNPLVFLAVGACLGVIGFLDDLYQLSPGTRLMFYFLGSIVFIASQPVPFEQGMFWVLTVVLLCIALVWVTNLYNFMDGLDGFATVQAIAVLGGMAILAALSPAPAHELIGMLLVPCAALVPFLFFNWAPASMFLGDAGSVFLGFYLGAMGLVAFNVQPTLAIAWLILMAPFLVDATLTLLLRVAAGNSPYIPHRDHCYQRLARMTGKASLCTLGLGFLQLCWQFPLAWWATMGDSPTWLVVIFSVIPSLCLLVYSRQAT